MRVVSCVLFFLFIPLFSSSLFAAQKGSETVVSIEPHYTFPAADTDNKMLAFGWFKNGFTLEDVATSCTFDSVFSINSNVNLHGGSLYLDNDLFFTKDTMITDSGKVVLADHALELGCKDLTWTGTICWDSSMGTIALNSHVTLCSTWTFSGVAILDGHGKNLLLNQLGNIVVEKGSCLCLKNIVIKGISGNAIRCLDDKAQIVFDLVRWEQSGDYSFTQGSFRIDSRLDIRKTFTFSYESSQQSTITDDATLRIGPRATLSYNPSMQSQSLLVLDGDDAKIALKNATLHAGVNGLQLTKGLLEVRGDCYFSSDATTSSDGILLGDGDLADNNLAIDVFPESGIEVTSGYVVYKNVE